MHGIKKASCQWVTPHIKTGTKKGNDMDFLKAVLGDDLFSQVKTAIDAHNSNEENKDKQIKVGNLGGGEYVGKSKYDALQELLNGKETELTSANDLIAELKKGTKGDEELQGKITTYEGQVADLQKQLADTKIEAAIKIALLSESPVDVDYLAFKLHEKMAADNTSIELDENDNIKGWDKMLEGLKTQCPTMFKTEQQKKIEEKRLPDKQNPGGESDPKTLEDALRMAYETNE